MIQNVPKSGIYKEHATAIMPIESESFMRRYLFKPGSDMKFKVVNGMIKIPLISDLSAKHIVSTWNERN